MVDLLSYLKYGWVMWGTKLLEDHDEVDEGVNTSTPIDKEYDVEMYVYIGS